MATLQIENVPDELLSCIQSVALEKNLTLNEAIVYLLKRSFEFGKIAIDRGQHLEPMSVVLKRIRSRPRVNPSNFGLADSTVLIREDRGR
jgi:hypothetical protein